MSVVKGRQTSYDNIVGVLEDAHQPINGGKNTVLPVASKLFCRSSDDEGTTVPQLLARGGGADARHSG